MDITFTNIGSSNPKLSIKSNFNKLVDFLYGTRSRTNRTIIAVFAAVIAAKMLEGLIVVPTYCAV